jgi:hypothetical protein
VRSLTVLLELLRMIVLLLIFMFVTGAVERFIYESFMSWEHSYHWYLAIGNFVLFFVIYRNYLQFKGWYKSKDNVKLSKSATRLLYLIAALIIIVPMIFYV